MKLLPQGNVLYKVTKIIFKLYSKAQWVEMLATEYNLSLIPMTHVVDGENQY